METAILIVSVIALSVSIAALIVAARKRKDVETVTREKVVEVIHAPVENPFVYDEETRAYRLDGSLYAEGFISALDAKNKNMEE